VQRLVDEAVVLSKVDFGEADQVVTLFGKTSGRFSVFAAGARKSKRRFAGAFELGTRLTVQCVAGRGHLVRLDSVDILEAFFKLRDDLVRIARAMYCVELCREMLPEHQANAALFSLLVDYLRSLEANQSGPTALIQFELRVLDTLGFRPELRRCGQCGRTQHSRWRFDIALGGVVCESCATHRALDFVLLDAVRSALERIQRGERLPLSKDDRTLVRKLIDAFIQHQIGKSLASQRFLAQVDVA
jgi:DNA repair protein RecO (recombination protein O)